MTQQRRYNNYTLAIMASFVTASIGVSLFLLFGPSLVSGMISQGMYDLLNIAFGVMTVSQFVAGWGYVGTTVDIIAERRTIFQIGQKAEQRFDKKKNKPIPWLLDSRRAELVGLLFGLGLAVALTALLFLKGAGPFLFHHLPIIGPIVFLVANMGMMAGLFGRLGRVVDYYRKKSRAGKLNANQLFRGRNINYTIAVVVGLVVGIVLASVILGVVGVTSAMTFGGAIPAWAGGLFGFLTISGATVSASAFLGRKMDLWLGKRTIFQSKHPDPNKAKTARARANPETVGTVIGIGLGFILATALVASGVAVSSGLFGLLLPFGGSTPVIYATVIAACAGTCNRLGAFFNELRGGPTDAQHSAGEVERANNSNPSESSTEEDGQPLLSPFEQQQPEPPWVKQPKQLSQAGAARFGINADSANKTDSGVIQGADLSQPASSPRSSRCY